MNVRIGFAAERKHTYTVMTATLALTGMLLIIDGAFSQNIRLIPGPDRGRLEVLYSGAWGTVCNRNRFFKNQAASVVCRALNQPSNNSYSVSGTVFGQGILMPRLSSVLCSGIEKSLFDCTLTASSNTTTSCSSSSYTVGVVCTNSKIHAGIKYDNKWLSSGQTINIFENEHLYCYARDGTITEIRDVQCSIKAVGKRETGSCPEPIYSLKRSNHGPLTCSVSNWQLPNQDSLTVFINVMYPPQTFLTSEMKVTEHTWVNITLTNKPNPLPYLTVWSKLGTNQRSNHTGDYRMHSNISRDDSGIFLVDISNEMVSSGDDVRQGYGRELIFVDVLYKPRVRCQRRYIVQEGHGVNITCEIDANPPPYFFTWTQSDRGFSVDGPQPSLIIDSVRLENTGRYKFTALNHMKDYTGKVVPGLGASDIIVILGDSKSGACRIINTTCPETTESPHEPCTDASSRNTQSSTSTSQTFETESSDFKTLPQSNAVFQILKPSGPTNHKAVKTFQTSTTSKTVSSGSPSQPGSLAGQSSPDTSKRSGITSQPSHSCQLIKETGAEPSSLSATTYAVTAVAVVSLLAVFMLSIVIIRMRKSREVPDPPPGSGKNIEAQQSAIYENIPLPDMAYTPLQFPNGKENSSESPK